MPELSPGLQCFPPAPVFRQLHKKILPISVNNYKLYKAGMNFTVSSAADRQDREPTVTAALESSNVREIPWF